MLSIHTQPDKSYKNALDKKIDTNNADLKNKINELAKGLSGISQTQMTLVNKSQ